MSGKQSERRNPWGELVAKALADEAFKVRLLADPEAVLAAEGVAAPEGVTFKVVADTESVRHLVLPAGGVGDRARLTEEELLWVSGGGSEGPSEEEPWGPSNQCIAGDAFCHHVRQGL